MEEYFEKVDPKTETDQTELFVVEQTLFDMEGKDDSPPAVAVGPTCAFCSTPVDASEESTHSEVLSWIRGKKKDSSVLRSYTGRYACSPCIKVLRSGIDPREPNAFQLLEEASVSVAVGDKVLFTDQSPIYTAGFSAGLNGNPDNRDPNSMHPDWKEGFLVGQEQRTAEEWIGSPSPPD